MRREILNYPPMSKVPVDHGARNGSLERASDHHEFEAGERLASAIGPQILTRCASEIEPTEIRWLWPNRIPRGRLTVLAGFGGLGKSFVTLAISSTLTTGSDWPDGASSEGAEAVLLLNCEDDPSDTIVPRLIAMGADLTRVNLVDGVQRTRDGDVGFFSLADDVKALEEKILETDSSLCVIDPISAYLPGVDSHRDADVRSVLGPLAAMAERTDCAIVLVAHLNKSASTNAAMRVSGSTAFVNCSRMAWLVAQDANDGSRRLLLSFKKNIVEQADGLAFVLEDNGLRWLPGDVTTSAEEVLAESGCSQSKVGDAVEWLREALSDGPVPVNELRQAADANGHAWPTVERAKSKLKLSSKKIGFGNRGKWCWELITLGEGDH